MGAIRLVERLPDSAFADWIDVDTGELFRIDILWEEFDLGYRYIQALHLGEENPEAPTVAHVGFVSPTHPDFGILRDDSRIPGATARRWFHYKSGRRKINFDNGTALKNLEPGQCCVMGDGTMWVFADGVFEALKLDGRMVSGDADTVTVKPDFDELDFSIENGETVRKQEPVER